MLAKVFDELVAAATFLLLRQKLESALKRDSVDIVVFLKRAEITVANNKGTKATEARLNRNFLIGVLTEVGFKVLPAPEATATLVFEGLDVAPAVEAMTAATATPFEVNAAAHAPLGLGDGPATLLRASGRLGPGPRFDRRHRRRLAAAGRRTTRTPAALRSPPPARGDVFH
jgi:FAD/FMN-containing dehydrogenase